MPKISQIKVVAALPAELVADAIYYVRVGTGFDIYVTNSSGTVVAYPSNQVNPVEVSQPEAEAGTEAGLRSWSPLRVRQAVSQGLAQVGRANLLVNSEFLINQRAFSGGALAAGSYGHDRWGAYNGGANYSVSGGVVTLASGTLCQVIESAALAGQQVTVSVEDPTGPLTVTLGTGTSSSSVTGTIAAGSGRRGVTLVVPSAVTGDLNVRLSGAVSFKRPKVEVGGVATAWLPVPLRETQAACYRYYYQLAGADSAGAAFAPGGSSNNSLTMKAPIPVRMRAVPAVSTNLTYSSYVAGPVGSNQWSLAAAGVAFTSFSGTPNLLLEASSQVLTLYIYGATASPAPNQFGLGSSMWIRADAELPCTD